MNKVMIFKITNRKGSAMIFVVIMFLVIMILAASMASIFSNNLKQTKYQQDSLEAYYLAYSAGMIAYEALLANNNEKLNEIINDDKNFIENSVSMGRGHVSVVAEKSTEGNFQGWIKIYSTAILDRNNLTYERVMYFDPSNPIEMLWTNK